MYEYQDGKRVRNVGFVKVEQADLSTVVHIHGKGLHLAEDKKLKVYIFYVKEGQCIGFWQGDIEHVNPAVNYRLTFTPEDTGRASDYPLIEGVILENAGRRRFAAVWDDMPVDVEKMQVWKGEPEPDLAQLAAQKAREEREEQDNDKEMDGAGENEPGGSCSGEKAEMRPRVIARCVIQAHGKLLLLLAVLNVGTVSCLRDGNHHLIVPVTFEVNQVHQLVVLPTFYIYVWRVLDFHPCRVQSAEIHIQIFVFEPHLHGLPLAAIQGGFTRFCHRHFHLISSVGIHRCLGQHVLLCSLALVNRHFETIIDELHLPLNRHSLLCMCREAKTGA